LPNGQLALELHTTMERNWLLESSTNLLNWIPVGVQPSSQGVLEFFEPISPSAPYKFYRAREVP
jgi:hypothetical protein